MDAYYRSGKLLDHREKADVAVEVAAEEGQTVEKVLISSGIRASILLKRRWLRAVITLSTTLSKNTGASGSTRCRCRLKHRFS
jgi:hypothetical protein